VLQTANFQENPEAELLLLKKYQPEKPGMVMEYWSGWFDHWFDREHHTTSVEGTVTQYSEYMVTFSLKYFVF
jgi:beta-galactosidase